MHSAQPRWEYNGVGIFFFFGGLFVAISSMKRKTPRVEDGLSMKLKLSPAPLGVPPQVAPQ